MLKGCILGCDDCSNECNIVDALVRLAGLEELSVLAVVFYCIVQCRINHGAGGAPAPGPLSSEGLIISVIIFIHTKYTKNEDSSVLRILNLDIILYF